MNEAKGKIKIGFHIEKHYVQDLLPKFKTVHLDRDSSPTQYKNLLNFLHLATMLSEFDISDRFPGTSQFIRMHDKVGKATKLRNGKKLVKQEMGTYKLRKLNRKERRIGNDSNAGADNEKGAGPIDLQDDLAEESAELHSSILCFQSDLVLFGK